MAIDRADHRWKALENAPGTKVTVYLHSRTVHCGSVTAPFAIDDYTRWRLRAGLYDMSG